MLTVRIGKRTMATRQNLRRWILQCMLVLVPVVIVTTVILQKYSNSFTGDWLVLSKSYYASSQMSKTSFKQSASSCKAQSVCAEDHISFFIQSGAANIVAPKICIQNNLVLGTVLNNAGYGINIVIVNEVEPLIEFLKSIETGSVALMASFDEPSSKLNDDARKLIADLGSSAVKSLGFRDNWVFVGGKGAGKSNFEKYMKNDNAVNKYENWPELIELQGCIPRYLE
ncbi:protein FAM3C-like isoform X3 [Channa argus]|uniref:protein FAM3C-like isoform X3 n=1 Tax=Channa argus TaxID=215402 RepID=UPI0035205003